jgi:glycosyltransferase involved in cell wall biosynthesis
MTPVPVASLKELPPPPPGCEGWPWTQQSDPVPSKPPGGGDWPSISIVMPSLNQAEYLEEAIRSVLLQRYPNLEFVIRDGGSTDGSVEIIRKYERWISHWVSQPDGGQSAALNAGFDETSGEVFNWLCSDDTFAPNTLASVGREFAADVGLDVLLGWGVVEFVNDPDRNRIAKPQWDRVRDMPFRNTVPQQSCFFRRMAVARQPLLDQALEYYMDYDLWCHLLAEGRTWRLIPQVLGTFRMYGDNKTSHPTPRRLDELEIVHRRYRREWIPLTMWYRRIMYPVDVWASRRPGRYRMRIKQAVRSVFILLLGPWYGFRLCRRISWPVNASPAPREVGE